MQWRASVETWRYPQPRRQLESPLKSDLSKKTALLRKTDFSTWCLRVKSQAWRSPVVRFCLSAMAERPWDRLPGRREKGALVGEAWSSSPGHLPSAPHASGSLTFQRRPPGGLCAWWRPHPGTHLLSLHLSAVRWGCRLDTLNQKGWKSVD